MDTHSEWLWKYKGKTIAGLKPYLVCIPPRIFVYPGVDDCVIARYVHTSVMYIEKQKRISQEYLCRELIIQVFCSRSVMKQVFQLYRHSKYPEGLVRSELDYVFQ